MPKQKLIRTTTQTSITPQTFLDLTRPMIGLPITEAWRGAGTAFCLEIGELLKEEQQTKNGLREDWVGIFGVMIQWYWRIERPQSVYFGSSDSFRKIDCRLPKLEDKTVLSVEVEGRL